MRLSNLFLSVLFSLLTLALICCKDTINDQSPNDIVFPDSGISYGKQVEPLFFRACAFSGCHGADTFDQRGFSLDTYDHMRFGRVSIIFPPDTAASPLMWWIEKTHGVAERMPPPPRDPLNSNQIKGIGRWILEGAQNN